ncbi:hypothetical protein Cthiooxydans_26600 [Comamonas thiooxydans]|uniref:hypothetical protein n=1 Tax=Comamonas thiooxydans TaxID=363952 RepID=UPI001E3D2EA3|nr:hypothetical protein [Comamonas thiooxydans]BDB70248.1 hypothetical protein Cthiooxydans_26600 [Comamonas thiooxydans]
MSRSRDPLLRAFNRAVKAEFEARAKAKAEAEAKRRADLKLMKRIQAEEQARRKNLQVPYSREKALLRASNRLQTSELSGPEILAPLGTKVGTVLKTKVVRGKTVRYQQAVCSCGGNNEKCAKCFGSGFYTKEVIDDFLDGSALSVRGSPNQESTFSNDYRGGFFGVRELGRFSSNPLHDDHD